MCGSARRSSGRAGSRQAETKRRGREAACTLAPLYPKARPVTLLSLGHHDPWDGTSSLGPDWSFWSDGTLAGGRMLKAWMLGCSLAVAVAVPAMAEGNAENGEKV